MTPPKFVTYTLALGVLTVSTGLVGCATTKNERNNDLQKQNLPVPIQKKAAQQQQ